jgi:actin-related protein
MLTQYLSKSSGQNVFLTGGMAQIESLQQRMEKELLEFRPFQSTFKVNRAGM